MPEKNSASVRLRPIRSANSGTDGEQRRVDHRALAIPGREYFRERVRAFRFGLVCFPARRLLNLRQRDHRYDHGHQAAQEHRAPTVMRADRIVERGRDEKSKVVARLQISGAHRAAVFGPRLRDIRSRHRPLAADADSREQPKRAELPHVLCER